MITSIPLELITSTNSGTLQSDAGTVQAVPSADATEPASGYFDSLSGVLTINIPAVGVSLRLGGLTVIGDLGSASIQGEAGKDGKDGINGTIARDGEQGPAGCVGSRGERGVQGTPGPRGIQGEQGMRGEKGERGEKGDAGTVQVYMQTEDPATTGQEVKAGALWYKP